MVQWYRSRLTFGGGRCSVGISTEAPGILRFWWSSLVPPDACRDSISIRQLLPSVSFDCVMHQLSYHSALHSLSYYVVKLLPPPNIFCNMLLLYIGELLATSPTHKLDENPLSAVHDRLLSTITPNHPTTASGGCLLHP